MSPSQLEFIRHILDECRFLLHVSREYTLDEIEDDPTVSRAVVRSIEIIGEASKKVDDQVKDRYPEIEWKKMAATRDVLIHRYFGVDYDIVREIMEAKIPDLYQNLLSILKDAEES